MQSRRSVLAGLLALGAAPSAGWADVGNPTFVSCLLYTSPSPRDAHESRMPSSA